MGGGGEEQRGGGEYNAGCPVPPLQYIKGTHHRSEFRRKGLAVF